MKQQNPLLESALEYASQDIPVFPLHTPTKNGGCSCSNPNCDDQGKHPRTRNGLKDATTDEKKIREWWRKWHDANIGLCTDDFKALDVDDGGEEELLKHPPLPKTVESITGSGKRHICFANPKNKRIGNKVKFLPGLDIRGEGGYIVAPPSLHKSGSRYKWKNGNIPTKDNLAVCPNWILDAIENNKKKDLKISANNGDKIPEGERNDTLFRYACRLRDKGLTEEEIFTLVTSKNNDKCETPLDNAEIIRLIESALSYSNTNENISTPPTASTIIDIRNKWLEYPNKNRGIKTPFKLLNAKMGGLHGHVNLQAIPKIGKSLWVIQIGVYAAQQGIHVAYVDFENGKYESMRRVCQQVIKCELHELDEKIKEFEITRDWGNNFHIYDISTIQNPESLKSIIPKDKPCLLIIDSLQRLPALREKARESLNIWLDNLNLIRSDNCTVLSISELNRESYNSKTTISGGKETGEIEYICDAILRFEPTREPSINSLSIILSRHSGKGKIGRLGLTKYRYFVENPDPESFKELRFEESEDAEILGKITMLEKEDSDGRIYLDDLAEMLDRNTISLGKTLNKETLNKMGYVKEKERRTGHEKYGQVFVKKKQHN